MALFGFWKKYEETKAPTCAYINSQFKNPRGIGGKIITFIQNIARVLDVGYGNGHLLKMII